MNSTDNDEKDNAMFLRGLYFECRNANETQMQRLYEIGGRKMLDEFKGSHCLTSFDGYACWNATRNGQKAVAHCPEYVGGFDPRRFAYRDCLSDGSWYKDPESGENVSPANYTGCVDEDDLDFRIMVNNIYIIGYGVSLAALMISLIIFTIFRSLRCTRIAIHIHLFASLALNNVAWLVWYTKVIRDVDLLYGNGFFCQFLHYATRYLMETNYMWMFCEGLHLHLALVVVFVRDGYAMKWFYVVGWGLPVIIVAVYAVVRMQTAPNGVVYCWLEDSYSNWFLTIPVLVSIFISLFFLINVMRILLTKLHSNSTNPAPVGIRKAVRAALILIPLFGLQHVLIPFRPEHKSVAEKVYEIFSAFLISMQGLCVSILFCFANVDVHMAMKMSYKRLRRHGTHVTHVTATTTQHQASFIL